MRRAVSLFTLFLFAFTPATAQDTGFAKKLCLTVSPHGKMNGLGNFVFRGRIWGADSAPHYGYWVVARDSGDVYWAQGGGGIRGDEGSIQFGVYNGSAYPETFLVLRVETQEDYANLRVAAREGEALDPAWVARMPQASPSSLCHFVLKGEPEDGTPVDTHQSCGCP